MQERELQELEVMGELRPGNVNRPTVVPDAAALGPHRFPSHTGLAAEQRHVFFGLWRLTRSPLCPVVERKADDTPPQEARGRIAQLLQNMTIMIHLQPAY